MPDRAGHDRRALRPASTVACMRPLHKEVRVALDETGAAGQRGPRQATAVPVSAVGTGKMRGMEALLAQQMRAPT